MNSLFQTYRPEGFHTLNGYLFVEKPEELISFLQTVFQAVETHRTIREEDQTIQNCMLRVGDSTLMIAQATTPFMGMRTCFYLFADNVDELFQLAVEQGGQVVFEPADMDYGDRQGGIVDPAGNYWWISKRLVEEPYKSSY